LVDESSLILRRPGLRKSSGQSQRGELDLKKERKKLHCMNSHYQTHYTYGLCSQPDNWNLSSVVKLKSVEMEWVVVVVVVPN